MTLSSLLSCHHQEFCPCVRNASSFGCDLYGFGHETRNRDGLSVSHDIVMLATTPFVPFGIVQVVAVTPSWYSTVSPTCISVTGWVCFSSA